MPHRLTDLHARLPPPGTLRAGLHQLDTRLFEVVSGTLSLWYGLALVWPGPLFLTGLAAGSHTLRLDVIPAGAATYYCRPVTQAAQEAVIVRIIELSN